MKGCYHVFIILSVCFFTVVGCGSKPENLSAEENHASRAVEEASPRERILLDTGWRFKKYAESEQVDTLIYDVRPALGEVEDARPADAMPTAAVEVEAKQAVLKPWIMPTANEFIADPSAHAARPPGSPGKAFDYVQAQFDDSEWQQVSVPHDWAIAGPFMAGHNAAVGGGMGRLPSPGVAWYRKALDVPETDKGKQLYLDVGGAMSYAMVWINGELAGGWPYGYASWRVDLTPYIKYGAKNQLAIRVDNPPHSSRWYPGGGLYRHVYLTKTQPVHVGLWGTYVNATNVSQENATINIDVSIKNTSQAPQSVGLLHRIFELSANDLPVGKAVVQIKQPKTEVRSGKQQRLHTSVILENPNLWGPLPTQTPHRYVLVTSVLNNGNEVDRYSTHFGVRKLEFDGERGVIVNGEPIHIKGVNQHHDLGALGAAFNVRAAERQLEILQEMGVNAIRVAHNPPAQEFLDLTDKMGFLVINEIFDSWRRKKTPLDFHLIFDDWSEPDVRSFIRRDRNHPSVITWSLGNEVGEQYTGDDGANVARRLHEIAKEEDPFRPTALSMNFAKPDMPLAGVMDMINLNYQGEGIRNAPAYAHLKGINTPPLYPKFHEAFPDKVIISSENAAAVSSRGEYLFPVAKGSSAPVADGAGGDPVSAHVSAYELYTAPFGSSADKVLGSIERHPYVAGGFIWSGWDYLGEPTPYYSARSSYFGVVDLAGFKKDRFYLYQAAWRPELPMVHILPHWNWPERVGKVTPVHVFTSGDEAELFVNGRSQGRQKKGPYEYRLRWDDVIYEPGSIEVKAYKKGELWAEASQETTGEPAQLRVKVDKNTLSSYSENLAFVTVDVLDKQGRFIRNANISLHFSLEGAGELVATDNGDPTSLVSFVSPNRATFNGKCLAIVRAHKGASGKLTLKVSAEGLPTAEVSMSAVEK